MKTYNDPYDDPNYGDEYYTDSSMLSNCCTAPAWGDIDDYKCGICSKCKEHAEFEPNEE